MFVPACLTEDTVAVCKEIDPAIIEDILTFSILFASGLYSV